LPELDELFGVTHTKQNINSAESLNGILVPDLERIASHATSMRRWRYLAVREKDKNLRSETVAEERVFRGILQKGGRVPQKPIQTVFACGPSAAAASC
jgi:hypothetical protein